MSDESNYKPFIPPPMEPPPPAAAPGTSGNATPPSPTIKTDVEIKQSRPHEGFYYRISRKSRQNHGPPSQNQQWKKEQVLEVSDTLIIETACAAPCWVYVVESNSKTGYNKLKICANTDGFHHRHAYTISERFDKLRVVFSDREIPGVTDGSVANDKGDKQNPTDWLLDLDRFNPSSSIGGRGHGPILTPEESSIAPRFRFDLNPDNTHQIQEKFLLRRLPSGYFLNVEIS
jgi:hypothetical protein